MMEEHMIDMNALKHRFRNIGLISLVLLLLSGCIASYKKMSAYVLTPSQQKLNLNLSEEDINVIKSIIDVYTDGSKETEPITGGIPFFVEYGSSTYNITGNCIAVGKDQKWKTYQANIANSEAADYLLTIIRICQKTYPGMFLNVMLFLGETVELKMGEVTVSGNAPEKTELILKLYACLYDAYQHHEDNAKEADWKLQIVLTDLAGNHVIQLSDSQIIIGDDIYSSDFSSVIEELQNPNE